MLKFDEEKKPGPPMGGARVHQNPGAHGRREDYVLAAAVVHAPVRRAAERSGGAAGGTESFRAVLRVSTIDFHTLVPRNGVLHTDSPAFNRALV